MIYKNGERMHDFLSSFYCSLVFYSLGGGFDKTIIPLVLVAYEMIIANSALRASLATYIEDITRWREYMNFMFEWQEQCLTSERSERVRYCSCHE